MSARQAGFISPILTFYLVITAWLTARRANGRSGTADFGAILIVLSVSAGNALYAWIEAQNGQTDDLGAYIFFGCIALLAAAGDVRLIVRGGIAGSRRLSRHLWRMCFATLLSGVSFLAQVHKIFGVSPLTNLLYALPLAILVFMIFWLFKVSLRRSPG